MLIEKVLTEVVEVKYLTQTVVELHVRLLAPDVLHFEAGQFMQFKINSLFRSYSFACAPSGSNDALVFIVELLEKGVGSDFVRNLKPGQEIAMRGPLGVMTFKEKNYERDAFFVATGVGVAPFYSIISHMLDSGYANNVTLLFGLRSEENVFYYDKFKNMARLHPNFTFTPILSRPESHWPGEVGRVTTYLDIHYSEFADRIFYICGGKEMVTDTRAVLVKHGHAAMDIKLEIFT